MNAQKVPIITIDGPSGVGKGTISTLLASELKWHLLDSGAVYRALAFAVLQDNIDLSNEKIIANLALALPLSFEISPTTKKPQIFLGSKLINNEIRSEECSKVASKIASLSKVRAALLATQREFSKLPGLIADGRDMGTVVFPNADCKFYLDATVEERANRRYRQLKTLGIDVNLAEIMAGLVTRDKQDSERLVAPLKPAVDAIIVDTTYLSIDEVVKKLLQIFKGA